MENERKNKKIIWVGIGIAILAVLLASFFVVKGYIASSYLQKGVEYFLKDDFTNARLYLKKSVELNQRLPEAYFYLGQISIAVETDGGIVYYLPEADYANAVTYYEKALEYGIEKKDTDTHRRTLNNLGFSYRQIGEYEKGDAVYLKKIELFPDLSFNARYFVAVDYFERFNKPQDAIDLLLPAFDSRDGQERYYYRGYSLLSQLFYFLKDYDNAWKYSELALRASNGKVDRFIYIVRGVRAIIYGYKKDFTSAEAELEKISKLSNPKDGANCIFATALLEGGDPVRAVMRAEGALGVEGDLRFACLFVFAEGNAKLGNKSEADNFMRSYLKETDEMPEHTIFILRNRDDFKRALGR